MTQYSSIWIRCPSCWHSSLMSSESTKDIENLICICKCGINITKIAKQVIKDYEKFIKSYIYIRDNFDSTEFSSKLDKLLDLYNKVVIT